MRTEGVAESGLLRQSRRSPLADIGHELPGPRSGSGPAQ
ncbi:hypothetical protein SFR_0218 [Streptomyces sp. FR-008]|nr:hypothetical protein SFR_0218 [Streptomyces sp. FR-008]